MALIDQHNRKKNTCNLIANTIIGTEMNRTCHVTTANTPKLLYAFKLALTLNMKENGTSRSTILKSEETCMTKQKVNPSIENHQMYKKVCLLFCSFQFILGFLPD